VDTRPRPARADLPVGQYVRALPDFEATFIDFVQAQLNEDRDNYAARHDKREGGSPQADLLVESIDVTPPRHDISRTALPWSKI
jgi:hypothetical protein